MEKSCCFFGHRDISEAIKPRLTEAITKLTDEIGIEDFYVGNQGGFDSLVLSVLKELAISNPKLRYSIVLAYLPISRRYGECAETLLHCTTQRLDDRALKVCYLLCKAHHGRRGAVYEKSTAQKQDRNQFSMNK